jgi:hypothetical protein
VLLTLLVLAIVVAVLAGGVLLRELSVRAARRPRRAPALPDLSGYDPGRERRAEARARELLRSCVNEEEWAMYRDLGFIRVVGRRPGEPRSAPLSRPGSSEGAAPAPPPYAYLVYPHKPIVAFVPETGRLLSEYCVEFPDLTGERTRLPASDDVLAKWMALTSDESRVIGEANMHLVGRQLDPGRVRRDLWRLAEWERRRSTGSSVEARGA